VIPYFIGTSTEGGREKKQYGENHCVDNCSISKIVAIRKPMLSTTLFFRSEMKQGSDFCVFLHSHARSVSAGNTLPC
jgi:hypothetical protein